jgi:Uma2 family endonuclease
MSTQPKTHLSPEQYLELERKAECKSEYYDGDMFAMSGSSFRHAVAVANLAHSLNAQMMSRDCIALTNDVRVQVRATGLYTYPDLIVVCGKPQFADVHFDTLLNPGFIAEVLSPSTEGYDRGRKFEHYRMIECLSEYMLISQDRIHVDLYRKQAGSWVLIEAKSLDDTIELQSIGCTVQLKDIYHKLELDA